MQTRTVLEEGIGLLGALLGDETLALDEAGMCSLSHQDGFVTMLIAEPESGMLLLSAQLLELPPSGREALLAKLLRLNFLGMETGGAALAIDEDERHVYLCHSVPLQRVDAKALVAVIGNFIDVAAGLRPQLLSGPGAAPPAPSGSAPETDPGPASLRQSGGWIAG